MIKKPTSNTYKKILIVTIATQILAILTPLIFLTLNRLELTLFLPSIQRSISSPDSLPTSAPPQANISIIPILWSLFFVTLEELTTRYIPIRILKRFTILDKPKFILFAIISSYIFAILHNTSIFAPRLPLVQFLAGIYYASLYRKEYGLPYAIYSHILYNVSIKLYSGLYI